MKTESLLKTIILSNGIKFTKDAMFLAKKHKAKGQNLCYNLPCAEDALVRPQELLLANRTDGYETVVSCVAPHAYRQPLVLDAAGDSFYLLSAGKCFNETVSIDVIREPEYYNHILNNGVTAKEYVSACGFDELNILPWSGCAISHHCSFCGIEKVTAIHRNQEKLTAHEISKTPELWAQRENAYFSLLKEALMVAKEDPIYSAHLHPIMISGNLSDDLLDYEAEIYSRISLEVYKILKDKMTEGIIAVIEPPPSDARLWGLYESKVSTVVFNLEVATEPWASIYCPGKNRLAHGYIRNRLTAALPIFGREHVWTNFVLGLEPLSVLIEQCSIIAQEGIVPSANVFHCDSGSRLCRLEPPSIKSIIVFFNRLADIYQKYHLKPFYCAKALRTSLANEAFAGRLRDD